MADEDTVYASTAFAEAHDCTTFDCGQPSLDEWLRTSALSAIAKRTGRTFVWTARDEPTRVVAYYTLSASLITRDSLPHRLGRGDPDQIPAALLGRLALDRRLHGQGLGSVLLVDALHRLAIATEDVAACYVVVDAIDEAAVAFYERHGFTRSLEERRLVRKMSDVVGDLLRYS